MSSYGKYFNIMTLWKKKASSYLISYFVLTKKKKKAGEWEIRKLQTSEIIMF